MFQIKSMSSTLPIDPVRPAEYISSIFSLKMFDPYDFVLVPFKVDTATNGFLKIDMLRRDSIDKQQGYFSKSTGDMGLKTVVTYNRGIHH